MDPLKVKRYIVAILLVLSGLLMGKPLMEAVSSAASVVAEAGTR